MVEGHFYSLSPSNIWHVRSAFTGRAVCGFSPAREPRGQEKQMKEFQKGEMTNSNGWTLEWGSAYIQVRDENGDFVAGWDPGKMNYIALAED